MPLPREKPRSLMFRQWSPTNGPEYYTTKYQLFNSVSLFIALLSQWMYVNVELKIHNPSSFSLNKSCCSLSFRLLTYFSNGLYIENYLQNVAFIKLQQYRNHSLHYTCEIFSQESLVSYYYEYFLYLIVTQILLNQHKNYFDYYYTSSFTVLWHRFYEISM